MKNRKKPRKKLRLIPPLLDTKDMTKNGICKVMALIGLLVPLAAADLELEQSDLAVIQDPKNEGYHFYIKKKPDIASILITETTKDPEKRLDNFAYRDAAYNSINGEEIGRAHV